MSLHLHWFLPTAGDSRNVAGFGPSAAPREVDLDYLTLVARTAEQAGFEAVLTPTGTSCDEAWIATAALIPETTRLQFMVAFRPGLVSPTLAAQFASTFQHLSRGRLLLNVVSGGSGEEQRRFGDHLDHDERYDRADEFITILRGAWSGQPFDFVGRHYRVEGATTHRPADPAPPVFFGGASDAGIRVAARQADTWLTWGEPPEAARARLVEVQRLAADAGRRVGAGIRFHVISRPRAEDAWAEAARLLDAMGTDAIAAAQRRRTYTDSVGQARMDALHGGGTGDLLVSPNLWAGFGLVRGGAGTALVGSHEEVADRISEYHELGFDHVILSGQPHVEEALWFGDGVMPILDRRGLLPGGAPAATAPSML